MLSYPLMVHCVFHLVSCGFIGVSQDYIVSDGGEDQLLEDTRSLVPEVEVRDVAMNRGSDSKDVLLPIVAGVLLKLFAFVPLVLSVLGITAGVSLAFSKVAILVGGALSLYYYLRETNLLFPLAQQTGYLPGLEAQQAGYLPGLENHTPLMYAPHLTPDQYTRDRLIWTDT